MNNKGQVLVLFVIVLPILLLCFIITADFLNVLFLKQTTQDEIREIIYSCIRDDKNLDEINLLVDKNIKYDDKNVSKSIDGIKVYIRQSSSIFGKSILLDYSYEGFIDNEKIVIREGQYGNT